MPDSPAQGHRPSRYLWAAIAAVALVAGYATPYGGWVESLFYGTGVRWQDAYTALDTEEANLPRHSGDRERLLIANAMADGEAPIGLPRGPRIHPIGTLARLRYETFDETGGALAIWDVRALVPNIGNGTGPFWREPCDRKCSEEFEGGSGTRIYRSGYAGIAEEWVLRMPVGKAFRLQPTPLRTQDILDPGERREGHGFVRVGDRLVPRPAEIRVTLLEACAADVRVGTTMSLEFDDAHLPIPRGLQQSRWAQLDGCGKLRPLPEPPGKTQPQIAR